MDRFNRVPLMCVPHDEEEFTFSVRMSRILEYMGPAGEAWCANCAEEQRFPAKWKHDQRKRDIYLGLTPIPMTLKLPELPSIPGLFP